MEWFKMYTKWLPAFFSMTDEEAGKAVKLIFQFVHERKCPRPEGRTAVFVNYALGEILQDIKIYEDAVAEDRARKEERRKKCQAAARKRWGDE
jgi:hypothetical protein